MSNTFREKYKIQRNYVEQSYSYHLALKNNKQYEQKVDEAFLAIVNLFVTMYPGVEIEQPQGREKTAKSMKTKIENLEIERLCKLFAIEGLSEEEKQELVTLIEKRVKTKEVNEICYGEIKDLTGIEHILKKEEIDDNIKTALLRIIKTRIEREERPDKEELLASIEKNYGQTAMQIRKQEKYNVLHWECIEAIKQDKEGMKKLHCPFEYLRIKDIRGFEIIISKVPDTIKTDNEMLKQLIRKRKEVPESEKRKYSDLCCIMVANEFAKRLMNDKEFLDSIGIAVLPEGYKHKKKENGYIADHVKFYDKEHPEYTFELQLRSIYRENLTRANGVAAHDKRSGKKRIFPSVENKDVFLAQSQNMVPKYTVLRKENEQYTTIHKCKMVENLFEYYLGYVSIESNVYQTAIQYLQEEQQKVKG